MRTTRIAALAALAISGLAAAPAHAALSLAGPVNPATSAAAFYQDANGLQLALCVSGTPNCLPGPTSAQGGEDFYYEATSTVTTPLGTASLILNVTLAPNASGNMAAFNRVRVQLDGFPAGTYTITHPYGTDTVVSEGGARARTTIDVGCLVATTGVCNFADALAGRFGPFLTPAPGAPAPPAGFIGNAVRESAVVGSPLGTNLFRVEGPGLPAGGVESTTFALLGKLFAGPVPAFAHSGDLAFADQLVGSTSATKTVTVTSAGIAGAGSALNIKTVALTGANATDYAIGANTCAGATLAAGATCTVDVTTTPSAAGARAAALTFTDNTATATHTVALTGKGTTPPPPPPPAAAPAPAPAQVAVQSTAPVVKPAAPVASALRVASKVRLRVARHGGIAATFTAPA